MAERTKAKISAPKGTRDLYPLEAARRRFLTETWRRAAIRHGFEEIDGPTFESLDLYTVKSGEGIVSELFQAYSGKNEAELEAIRAGKAAPYALRPEFTPTLARMYADRASSLPPVTKWFSVGPFFRAERPQRGRLREFLQWNVDQIGDATSGADAEVVASCVGALEAFGTRARRGARQGLQPAQRGRGAQAMRHHRCIARWRVRPARQAPEAAGRGLRGRGRLAGASTGHVRPTRGNDGRRPRAHA